MRKMNEETPKNSEELLNGSSGTHAPSLLIQSASQSIIAHKLSNNGGVNYESNGSIDATNVQSIVALQGSNVVLDKLTYNIHNYSTDEAWKESIQWLRELSGLDFYEKQKQCLKVAQAVPSTGSRVLKDENYLEWRDGNLRQLWCYGHPGVGKTILSSVVVDDVEKAIKSKESRDHHRRSYAYVYFDYQERDGQTPMRVLANILMQLVQQQDHCSRELRKVFKNYQIREESPGKDEFIRLIISELTKFYELYLVLDALDECLDDTIDNKSYMFLAAVMQLPPKVKVLFTSRPDSAFYGPLDPGAKIEVTVTHQDLVHLVNSRIESSESLIKLVDDGTNRRGDFHDYLCESIVRKSHNTLLLANLHMDFLARQMMQNETPTLSEDLVESHVHFYQNTLDRVFHSKLPDKSLAMKILTWACFAGRPVTATELGYTLDTEVTETLLASVCKGIVSVDANGHVRLVHHTAREYIVQTKFIISPHAHADLAATCLDSLTHKTSLHSSKHHNKEQAKRLKEFRRYAADYWGSHLRRAPKDSAVWKNAVECMLDQPSLNNATANMTDLMVKSMLHWKRPIKDGIGPLHLAIFFGSKRLSEILLHEYRVNVDVKTHLQQTPLHWAVIFRQKRMVQHLLEQGADPNMQDSRGRTPLHWAIANHDRECTETLLKNAKCLDFHLEDKLSHTPLRLAADMGINWAVERLIKYSDINHESRDGWSAIRLAAQNGFKYIVRTLLDHEAMPTTSWEHPWSLLCMAAENGDEELVEYLIHKELDLEQKNLDNLTALQLAVRYRHDKVAWQLIRAGAHQNIKDSSGDTLIHAFVRETNSETDRSLLHLLLENSPCLINHQDKNGMTALQVSVLRDDSSSAWLLVEKGADCNIQDDQGRTALHLAIEKRRYEAAWLLVVKGIDCNVQDLNGRTPLHMAVYHGLSPLVSLLLSRGADANVQDKDGCTSLHCAAKSRHSPVVSQLLQMKAKCEVRDNNGKAPLHYAFIEKDEQSAMLLIQKETASVNYLDDDGRIPLHLAATAGSIDLVRVLLQYGSSINKQDNRGCTALHLAILGRHVKLACVLIEKKANINLVDSQNESVLHYAARLGNSHETKDLIECLLSANCSRTELNASGKTPSQVAVENYQEINYWT